MNKDFSLGTVEVALAPQERFEEYLQSRGKRTTQQRRYLVDLVFRHHDHFDADDVLEMLSGEDEGRKIGRATVYRTLNELVEAGLLRAMTLDGRSVYERDYGYPQHDHLHCQICNKLIEFHSAELQELRDAVAAEHKFRASGHRLIIAGTCYECRTQRHRRKSPLDLI